VLLTIDLTERVMQEAIAMKAGAVIAYHPPIFEPLARVTDATPRQRVILHALEHRIAIYSPHTALDNIPGGVTDWLCEGLSLGDPTPTRAGKIHGDCRALAPHARAPRTQEVKLVTFVPEREADRVREALASAGAGMIGAYQVCSFSTPGTGTFLAGEGTNPFTTSTGRTAAPGGLERVSELRLEMVCSKAALPLAMETLRRFHPYEEPAIDAYELMPEPKRSAGSGRRLVLDKPATVAELAQRLKAFTGRDSVRYALADPSYDRPVKYVGVVPGSGEALSRLAREEGCEVFVTGEMKHHEVLGALNAGMNVLLGGHTSTERGYLARLKAAMEQLEPGLTQDGRRVELSREDRTPLVTV
jgi:dinuclear metal center YbgI/SA1388 family protein